MKSKETSIDPARIVGCLEALIGRNDVAEDYVRFRIAVFRAQHAMGEELAGSTLPSSPLATGWKKTNRKPMIDADTLPLDRALLKRLLADLLGILGGPQHRSEDLARLSAAAIDDAEVLEELTLAAAFGPHAERLASLSGRLEVSPDGLLFFGRVLVAPFVTAAVHRLKQQMLRPPEVSGHCPWCGSPPGLAKLRAEDGRRILCCSLCGHQWPFARLTCPFCEQQGALDRLSVDMADGCSIETCPACRGYLKTVDQRKLSGSEPFIALVHAVATLHLDLIAEREGCVRAIPYAAVQ